MALTAHAFDEEMQACLDAGMDDFLTKPIRKAALLEWMLYFQAQLLDEAEGGTDASPIEGAA